MNAAEDTAPPVAPDAAGFRALADALPALAWYADAAGAITWSNARWLAYCGDAVPTWTAACDPATSGEALAGWAGALARGEAWEGTVRLRRLDGAARWFATRAEPVRDAGGRLVRWVGTHLDVDAQRRSAEADAFLVEASAQLGSSVDYETTLATVARLAVPGVSDWCAVDVVGGDGAIVQLAVAHVDPSKLHLARELRRLLPPERDAPYGVPAVVRTGRSEVAVDVSDAMIVAAVPDPAAVALLREIGLCSSMCVPMIAQGRVLGAITFVSAQSGRRFDAADLALAEELARRAAVAIERARLLADARRAEDLAHLEARRVRLALDAGRMGDWEWDVASGQVRWSPQVEAMYGLAPGTFDGTLAQYVERLHPDDRALVRANVDRAVTTGSELHHEHRVLWPDGTVRWIEGRGAPVFSRDGALEGLLGVCTDITARKDAEHRLQEREASLRFLSEASAALAGSLDDLAMLATVTRLAVPALADCAIVDLADADGTLRRAACAHVDPASEATAWELGRRFPPTQDEFSVIGRALRMGAPAWVDVTPALLDALPLDPAQRGLLMRLELRSFMSVPVTTRERVAGVFTLASSGPGRRFGAGDAALATEVARRIGLALENAQLYREARDANRMKDEFLATLSHELRTPMTAILGWTAMLPARLDDPAALRRGLAVIERNARAQARLIDDVLDVSRIVAGKLRLDAGPIPFGPMVGVALDAIRPRAQDKGVALTVDLGDDLGVVLGDADRLQQVVWNLCQNAVKFTPMGGVVTVRGWRDAAAVSLAVSDTGQGIAGDFLPHVFDRFRQADSSSTRSHGGLGLGLAITRHLVELHGGTVTAQSAGEGQGATFTVTLPLAASGAVPAGERSEPAPAPASTLTGLRVLVCDDEVDAREMVAESLRGDGAVVTVAGSAAEALACFDAAPPEVLVSDIGMPGEDGYALLRQVRARAAERGGRVPALALTAYAQAEDARRAMAAGFQRHVTKPVEPARLIAVIAELARLARQE